MTLHIKQTEGPPTPPNQSKDIFTHIVVEQTATAGLKGTTERRCLDWTPREHSDWMFGKCAGKSKWIAAADITDPYLKEGWEEGEAENTGVGGVSHIQSLVESIDNGWTAEQIWGFQVVGGERHYTRNIIVEKGDERVTIRLVYDYYP